MFIRSLLVWLQFSVAVQHAENGREDVEQGFDELNHVYSWGEGGGVTSSATDIDSALK